MLSPSHLNVPLVVAYALAGTMDFDFDREELGKDANGDSVFLRDIWPSPDEVQSVIDNTISSDMFKTQYASVFEGDERWKQAQLGNGRLCQA